MPLLIRATANYVFPNGTADQPSVAFGTATTSGVYAPHTNALGFACNGASVMTISNASLHISGNIIANRIAGNGYYLTGITTATNQLPFSISSVQITDASYIPLDDTALSTTGGYLIIHGTNFLAPLGVVINNVAPTSIIVASSTKVNVQMPAVAAGSYPMYVSCRGYTLVSPQTILVSPFPAFSTSTISAAIKQWSTFRTFTAATEATGSSITYSVATGSALPAGATLPNASTANIVANVTDDPNNTTTYSFDLTATDTQLQNTNATFSWALYGQVANGTGGTVTTSGNYKIHTFSIAGSNTFTVTKSGAFNVLVIGGGGGGSRGSGVVSTRTYGGAGGDLSLFPNVPLTATSYTVFVGNGGAGATTAGGIGATGSNSYFQVTSQYYYASNLVANGGRGGTPTSRTVTTKIGPNANGTLYTNVTWTSLTSAPGSPGAGGNVWGTSNVNGGNGYLVTESAFSIRYAGGGGGTISGTGGPLFGVGGTGGGGSAATTYAGSGSNGTPPGGGGGASGNNGGRGGNGAPGAVIIYYRFQ